jgi:hypothetical protein
LLPAAKKGAILAEGTEIKKCPAMMAYWENVKLASTKFTATKKNHPCWQCRQICGMGSASLKWPMKLESGSSIIQLTWH